MSFARALQSDLMKLSGGHSWCEGAAWLAHSQQLVFSDVKQSCLYCYDTQSQQTRLITAQSNYSNGNVVLSNGDIVSCEHGRRCLSLRRADHLDQAKVLVEKFEGKRLNSPNDVIERRSDGTLWFTDPPYGILNDEEGYKSESQIIGCWVYCFDPKTGQLHLATTDVQRPNGLAFSPDESTLYVADMSIVEFPECGRKEVRAYRVNQYQLEQGKTLFHVEQGIPDGMTVDRYGQIYCSSAEGILVYNPTQQVLVGKIPVPEVVSNCTFDHTQTRLFITASSSVYAIDIDIDCIANLAIAQHA